MLRSQEALAPQLRFLLNGGETGKLILTHDWSDTPLGPLEQWPVTLRVTVSVILQSEVPMAILWGPEGVMLYNDAYSVFADKRHPAIFGRPVFDGWEEARDFNANVLRVGLQGGTLAYRDIEMTLYRKGYAEQVWMNLDYSPILDEGGIPVGIIAIVVETTQRVLAGRRVAAEHERLHRMFEQAPGFMAMVQGTDHVFEMVNPGYEKLVDRSDILGRTVREVLPEIVGQGFAGQLDEARNTGEAVGRLGAPVWLRRREGTEPAQFYIDYVMQPIRDDAGEVTHIFVQGSDVTARVLAERRQRLLMNELNHRVKNTLSTVQAVIRQTLRHAASLQEAGPALSARIVALSQAQNVLTAENWTGADIGALVEATVAAHGGEGRMHAEGPPLRLASGAAISFALALHELATNAGKYGALSNSEGQVAITWRVEGDAFTFRWQESNGPPVAQPTRRGFGSQLIGRGLTMEMNASTHLDYAPSGLTFTLGASLDSIREVADLD